jgi:hypothetical protein
VAASGLEEFDADSGCPERIAHTPGMLDIHDPVVSPMIEKCGGKVGVGCD